MKEKIEEITSFIQERCLWQFFSRTWDREENIEGILTKVTEILTGEHLIIETPTDKYFYAEAKILASDIRNKFSWVKGTSKVDIKAVIDGVKARITEIAIEKSRNCELNMPNY